MTRPEPSKRTRWSTFSPHRNKAKADTSLRTLSLISIAHWVSHFHLLVLPMLFPFLKAQLGVGYVELGFALTVFAVVSALTQAPTGYLVDHVGARKILHDRPDALGGLRADPARPASRATPA